MLLISRLRVGLLACALAPTAATAQEGLSADQLFGRGVQLHQAGDILGAIESYSAALEKDPGRLDARSNLGAAYARLGRYEDAIEHYRLALEAMPEQHQIRFNLGVALYKAARVVAAGEELQRVVEGNPEHQNARLLLADCLLQQGLHARVVGLLEPREESLGDNALYAYLMGTALLERNELMRGQQYIDRLFRDGETAEGHVLMGAAHIRREAYAEAIPELKRAAEMNPALPTVHSLLGRAYTRTGEREEAAEAFRRELAGNPNDFEANLYLGLFYKDEDRMPEAWEHLNRARRLRPEHPAVLYGLGAYHLAEGQAGEAQPLLEALVEALPRYREGHVLLATVYYRQKRRELGDEHRDIAEQLRALEQEQQPGADPGLGPIYTGDETPATEGSPGGDPRP
jgi:tetratricopeptide (TPR) repeat protein